MVEQVADGGSYLWCSHAETTALDDSSTAPSPRTTIERSIGGQTKPGGRALVAATVVLAVLAVIYTLYLGETFLAPTFTAAVLALMIAPIPRALERIGVPTGIAAAMSVFGSVLAVIALLLLLTPTVQEWIDRGPEVLRSVEYKLRHVKQSVEAVKEATEQVTEAATVDANPKVDKVVIAEGGLLTDVALTAPGIAVQMTYTTVLMFFLLLERKRLKRFAVGLPRRFPLRLRMARMFREIGKSVSTYLFTVACINIGLGICTAAVLYLLGVPSAPLWGAGMTVLNFVPYLGPAVMLGVIGMVGLTTFDTIGHALLPVVAVFGLNVIESQFVLPFVVGKRAAISPLTIFLAVAFGGWMWGMLGSVLAVPTVIIATTALGYILPRPVRVPRVEP